MTGGQGRRRSGRRGRSRYRRRPANGCRSRENRTAPENGGVILQGVDQIPPSDRSLGGLTGRRRRGRDVTTILQEKIKSLRRRLCSLKWKISLIKNHMTGDDNASGREIEAAVALLGGGITDEHASRRAWSQFVRCRGTKVWVAQAAKNSKRGIVWHRAMQEMMWYTVTDG